MANPARIPDDPRVVEDPANHLPPLGADPLSPEPRLAANDPDVVQTRIVQNERSGGTSVLIAAVVIALAVIAYFLFAPGASETPAPDQPTAAEPAAPDATAPAAPQSTAPAVPEPSTWAMMLIGFGLCAAAMRSKRNFRGLRARVRCRPIS